MKVWNNGEKVKHDDLNQNFLGDVRGTSSGKFFQDQGAIVRRFADRFFIGAATDNPGNSNRDLTPTDWLTTALQLTSIGPWPVAGATGASLSRFGNIGWLGASRTSDSSPSGAAIGITGWAIADNTTATNAPTAYAGYLHAMRKAGVNVNPTFALELEVANYGTVVGVSTPYQQNVGGGTYCLQIGSGGGDTNGTLNTEAGIVFVDNPTKHGKGIIFGKTSLAGVNGNGSGYAGAVSMAAGHGVEWYAQDGNPAVLHFSSVTASAYGSRIQHLDNVIIFTGSDGAEAFGFRTSGVFEMAKANAGIEIGSSFTANAPYIDFHSSGSSTDYDARIIGTGGSGTSGQGGIDIYALQTYVRGQLRLSGALVGDAAGHSLGGLTVSNALAVGGNIAAGGNVVVGAGLTVGGGANLQNNLVVAGSTALVTLNVSGAAAFASTLTGYGGFLMGGRWQGNPANWGSYANDLAAGTAGLTSGMLYLCPGSNGNQVMMKL